MRHCYVAGVFIAFWLGISAPGLQAQSGVNVKIAANALSYEYRKFDAYTGYQLGLDAILDDRSFIIMPGVHYYATSLDAQSQRISLSTHAPSIHGIKGNLYLGERFIRGDWFKWKVYGGGGAWFTIATDENVQQLNEDDLQDVSFSLEAGTGVELKFFTIDLLYVHGTNDVFKTRDQTKRNAWTFAIGFFF